MQKKSNPASKLPSLDRDKSKIEVLETQLREKEDLYLRTLAEFDNYRKRVSKEGESLTKARFLELFLELLLVHDSFDRAFQSEALKSDPQVYQGVRSIQRQVHQLLEKNGVMSFESVGQNFDPSLHEAVSTESSDRFVDGTVIRELQKGYVWEGKVLRAAKVVVARNSPRLPSINHVA
jgi:molecular chaperone GrpE